MLRLEQRLAIGGFSEVWLGRYHAMPVVVKRLLPQYRTHPVYTNLFQQEAELMQHFEHPNLCSLIATHEQGLIYEYINGCTLEAFLLFYQRHHQAMPLPHAITLMKHIAAALHYVHTHPTHPTIHRDVTPSNILLSLQERMYLIDFGIAKISATHNVSDNLWGKWRYLAPEQLSHHYCSQASDQYALAQVILECVQSPMHVLRAQAPQIANMLQIMLQDDFQQRFPSMQHVVNVCSEYLKKTEPVFFGPWVEAVMQEQRKTRALTPVVLPKTSRASVAFGLFVFVLLMLHAQFLKDVVVYPTITKQTVRDSKPLPVGRRFQKRVAVKPVVQKSSALHPSIVSKSQIEIRMLQGWAWVHQGVNMLGATPLRLELEPGTHQLSLYDSEHHFIDHITLDIPKHENKGYTLQRHHNRVRVVGRYVL